MKRTIDEKLKFNNNNKSPFSTGYCLGVTLYRDYRKQDKSGKKTISELIDTNNSLARSGDELSKGFMCGVRDAANERKGKK
jgi:hypothetical protein